MRAKCHEAVSFPLTAYSHSARAVLAKERFRPAKAWIAYSAAAGAALTMVPSAEAAPVYSGLQDIRIALGPSSPSSFTVSSPFDLDGNGFNDFAGRINRDFIPHSTDTISLAGRFEYPPVGGDIFINPTGFKLASGDTISSLAGTFNFYRVFLGRMYSDRPPGGPFLPSQAGFVGVRFKRDDNNHFGWIRVHIDRGALTIKDWAYESTPDAPIRAGEGSPPVPEPSGLALLATGAAGILAWRRRRHGQDRQ